MKTVKFELSLELAKYLNEILSYTQDEGPPNEGWQSDRLGEISHVVWKAVNEVDPQVYEPGILITEEEKDKITNIMTKLFKEYGLEGLMSNISI